MELKDLRPKRASFELENGREYFLRPLSLSDEIWLQENIGPDGLAEVFANDSVNMPLLSRIIYHQIEDKSDFIKKEITVIDEDGNETIEHIGGCKLFQLMIIGMESKINIIHAFNQVMGASRPEAEESSSAEGSEVKKK